MGDIITFPRVENRHEIVIGSEKIITEIDVMFPDRDQDISFDLLEDGKTWVDQRDYATNHPELIRFHIRNDPTTAMDRFARTELSKREKALLILHGFNPSNIE